MKLSLLPPVYASRDTPVLPNRVQAAPYTHSLIINSTFRPRPYHASSGGWHPQHESQDQLFFLPLRAPRRDAPCVVGVKWSTQSGGPIPITPIRQMLVRVQHDTPVLLLVMEHEMTEQEAKALASELADHKIYRVVGIERSSFDEDEWIVLVMLRSVGGRPGVCVYEYTSPEPRSISAPPEIDPLTTRTKCASARKHQLTEISRILLGSIAERPHTVAHLLALTKSTSPIFTHPRTAPGGEDDLTSTVRRHPARLARAPRRRR